MQTAPRILAFGDNVVDCYRARHLMFPGGNCVNHAVFARRFGAVSDRFGIPWMVICENPMQDACTAR